MPHIHYDLVGSDLVGTVAGVAESIGSLDVGADAKDLLAFVLAHAGSGVATLAETIAGKFTIDGGSLFPQNLNCQSKSIRGGSSATNIGNYPSSWKWLPVDPVIKDVSNKTINFKWTSEENGGNDVTEDVMAAAGVVYASGNYPQDALGNVDRLQTRFSWMDTANGDDVLDADGASFEDSIRVPGWVKEIIAFGSYAAITTLQTDDEGCIPATDISGTIPGLSPMFIPSTPIHAELGTKVDNNDYAFEQILPAYIENINRKDSTLDFKSALFPAANVLGGVGIQTITLYGR